MSDQKVTLHRVIPARPEKVFLAFSLTPAFISWLPPYGFVCDAQQHDFREGGIYKMRFINLSTGKTQSFGGEYLEIRQNEFIKYTDRIDDPNMSGDMLTTISLVKVSVGTEMRISQENIPTAIPVEACYLGWQDSLEKLRRLVEPNIPDA